MNTVVTSKEEILRAALSICREEGIQALSIRAVAQRCDISIGSVYNYFPSKAALVALSVQEIWMSIFKLDAPDEDFPRFTGFIQALYERIRAGSAAYPNFFAAHSLNFSHSERAQGAEVMRLYFEAVRGRMAQILRQDAAVRPDIGRDPEAVRNLTGFCLDHMLGCLMLQRPDCASLLRVLERLLYAA